MEHVPVERRKEARYPIEAKALVRKKNGETIPATAVDLSSSGMLLHLDLPFSLTLDEEVTVDVELPQDSNKPFSSWGIGRVARIDTCGTAVQLYGGQFESVQQLEGTTVAPMTLSRRSGTRRRILRQRSREPPDTHQAATVDRTALTVGR